MPSKVTYLKCVLIGNGSLAFECVKRVLSNQNYELIGLISSDSDLQLLAREVNIPFYSQLDDGLSMLEQVEFDFLFSVVNEEVLPASILKRPRQAAINFHDSLLPRYAGLHATSWAILNQEKVHGVTWHRMSETIDAGDILKQQEIKIEANDTALVLNIKCYEVALDLFEELLDDLKDNHVVPKPQNLNQRTFYRKSDKPPKAGVLDFNDTSANIYSVWRALYFGHHVNNFASCKLISGLNSFIVDEMKVIPAKNNLRPGEIVAIENDFLRIATKTDNIVIAKLKTLDGRTCSIQKFIQITQLEKGDQIQTPNNSTLGYLSQKINSAYSHERFWVDEWKHANQVKFPYFNSISTKANYFKSLKLKIQPNFKKANLIVDWECSILTLFAIYIFRLTNIKIITFGVVVNNEEVEAELFANILPFNIHISPDDNFEDIYHRIAKQKKLLDDNKTHILDIGYRYPDLFDVPINFTEFYPIIFELENDNNLKKNTRDFSAERYFKVTLNAMNKECCLELSASKQDDFKPKQLLHTIKSHVCNINNAVINDIKCKVTALPLLNNEERAQLLSQSTNEEDKVLQLSVLSHFKEQVKRQPESVAVVLNEQTFTYKELDDHSGRLAGCILKNITAPQQHIVIFINQSEFAIIAMLAVLKANCVYVPIDPENPIDRIQYILKDVNASLVLTNSLHKNVALNAVDNLKIPVIDVSDTDLLSQYSIPKNYHFKVKPDDLVYILYTSGSTGFPKGVQVCHKSIVRLVKNQNYIEFELNDVVAQFTTLSFDVSTFEIWGALLNGSILRIIDKQFGLDPEVLSQTVKKDCTILFMTPSVFVEVFKSKPDTFDNLRVLILGGEALRTEDIHGLIKRKKFKKLMLTIINGYGPTENTGWSTYYSIEKLKRGQPGVPIGKPISFTDAYILDEYQNLLPMGVPGELYLGGVGLAKGYLNNAKLTQEAFIRHPFSNDNQSRLYKTGDIVRMLPDGNLIFLGRKDNQIKIRGIRVELGEIESWLLRHPSVKQGVVIAKNEKSRRYQLIAYIVPNGNDFNTETIQRYLAQFLPDYMVPFNYVVLDKFPLTTSNKVDKSMLPEPTPYDSKNYQAPLNEKEHKLAKVWSNILRAKQIGRNDNFFALGGDSIIAMQIITKINQEGWTVRPSDIFNYPTIAKLAKKMKSTNSSHIKNVDESLGEGKIPLTPVQSWFFDMGYKSPSNFSQAVLVSLNFIPDNEVLEKSFNALIQHHSILRASFDLVDGSWEQIINNKVNLFKLYHEKLASKKFESKVSEMESKILKKYSGFNLNDPPMIKGVLFQDKTNYYLAIIVHHLIIDSLSWRIFLDDLLTGYHTFSNNQTIVLPMKSSSFQSWSDTLLKLSKSNKFLKEYKFWEQQSCQVELPVDFKRGENIVKNTRVIAADLDLNKISLRYKQVRPIDILITALVATLREWVGQNSVNFYVESHGRDSFDEGLDLSRTMGWFTSLYPIKFTYDEMQKELNILKILKTIRRKYNGIKHHGMGYGILKYLTDDPRIKNLMNEIKVSSFCFNFLGNFDAGINVSDFQFIGPPVRLIDAQSSHRPYLIELSVWIKNDKLHMEWTYSSNFHKLSTVQKLSNRYINHINAIVEECVNSIHQTFVSNDFPLVSLTQNQLNICINKYPNLENITQLSSLQSGLLFHRLQYPDSYIYHSQLAWQDNRGLDLGLFKKAWEAIVERHSIFRTNFLWKHFDHPVQVTDSYVNLPWKTYDCSSLSKKDQDAKIKALLREDQERCFDFSEHPLMRISVIKTNSKTNMIVWTHHHILLGGWSINTVISEVYEIYKALENNVSYNLPHPVPFSEYIAFQIQKFNKKLSKKFWVDYLRNFSGTSIINELGAKNENLAPRSRHIEFLIPDEFTVKLKKFANSSYVSLNTVMLYAWVSVIARYTNAKDVGVGIVVSTKPNENFHKGDIVGPLINTLPFRFQLDPNEHIQTVFAKINSHIFDLTKYSHTALLDIYSWLKRNTQVPLFDTLFVFENYPLNFNDQYISDFKVKEVTHYPLVLTVFPGEQIRLIMAYDKNVLQEEIVSNIMSNYYSLLCEIIKSKKSEDTNFNVLSKNEMAILKNMVYKNRKNYPEDSIPSLFHKVVKKNSRKTAVHFKGEEISYSDLDKISNKWANYLMRNDVKKGDAVAIYIDRSIEMVVAILAVLKTGAAYVPIDITFPKERVHFILKDVGVTHILTQSTLFLNLKANYQEYATDIFNNSLIENDADIFQSTNLKNSDLAYLVYTSGTTGVPKGIPIMHRSVVNAIYSIFNDINITSSDKILSFTSIAFDISVLEIIGALLWGMELEIVSSDTINNPSLLIRCIQDCLPTLIQATPGFLQMILNAGWQNGRGIKILCGGEALTNELAHSILNTGASLWNMYGPSETTIWSTMSPVSLDKKVNIGKPIANTEVYVLDNQKQLVPIGVTGELYIGGEGVSKGYVNRPELSAQQFISNPFSNTGCSTLYRTGDLVKWTPNGDLEYIDRVDNQIKIRGYRVELEEIRSVILKHRYVKDAIVLKVGSSYDDSRLVAFCILKDPKIPIANNEINITISPYLPHYMVPDEFIFVSNFSLDSNGKIDKKLLLASYNKLHRKKTDNIVSVKNPTEQLILNIFRKVLGSNNIGLNDNFFELGGNSISAIQILSSIQECFSISLSMHDILTLLTPHHIAQAIILKKFQSIDSYEHIPSPIVCLQQTGDKSPLFLIHPVGGTIFWFVKLASLLAKDRPVYAIQDPALFTERAHFSTFEAMAAFYANEIKNIQPRGPYFLAGASFGANMAAEIAKEFITAGETVAFVGLLDGWGIYPDVVSTQKFLKKKMKSQYDDIKKKLPEINTHDIKPIIDIAWHRSHLLAAYHLDWVDCPLTLFKAERSLGIFSDIESPHNHWLRYTPHLNIQSVPGDHETMFFEPNVEKLAKKLSEAIEQSEHHTLSMHSTQFKTSLLPITWTQAQIAYPNISVTTIFEAMVEQDHSAFAAVFNGRCFTYEKLNNCANQLAHYLIDLGVTKGDVIGIHLDRDFEMLIAVLGILKSGAAYAPIHLAEPPSRIDNIQLFCRAVITQKDLLRKFNLGEKKTICIDRDWQFIRHKSTSNPAVDLTLDDVAIIMCSSVSQVNPPSVIITHRNISNVIQWSLSEFTQDELIGVLASTPLGNELSIFELFSPLCSGGAVHIVKTIENLSDVPFSSNITLVSSIPSCMNNLLKNQKIPKSVKTVILVNEYTESSLIKNIYENTDIDRVFNVYMQTEVGLLTAALIPKNFDSKPPIGKPIPNAKIYILNQNLESVHAGNPGELYVSGSVLSTGYINNPELTFNKFIDNPFNDGNKKLFKTNALVTLGADGNLYYLGPSDAGLNIKGLYEDTTEAKELLEEV